MITIRPERPDDVAVIRQITHRAFGSPGEADLVDRLRAADNMVASLVAERDGQVVGHVLFSPVTVTSAPPAWRAVGLAPVIARPASTPREQDATGGIDTGNPGRTA